ncbi:hypothetical protein VTO42DRAFT_5523 [Malbranchea cinnamomea]
MHISSIWFNELTDSSAMRTDHSVSTSLVTRIGWTPRESRRLHKVTGRCLIRYLSGIPPEKKERGFLYLRIRSYSLNKYSPGHAFGQIQSWCLRPQYTFQLDNATLIQRSLCFTSSPTDLRASICRGLRFCTLLSARATRQGMARLNPEPPQTSQCWAVSNCHDSARACTLSQLEKLMGRHFPCEIQYANFARMGA